MQVGNCVHCGKLFLRAGGALCPDCVAEEDRQFEAVREYLKEHPGSPLQATAEATGVPRGKILRFLRQGRLVLAEPAGDLLCERCGKPIPTGTICPGCADELKDRLDEARTAARQALKGLQGGRMHIADWLKGRRQE